MMEDKPMTGLPDLPLRGFVTGLAEDGIEVTPARPRHNRPAPEPRTLEAHKPTRKIPVREDEPVTELPEMGDLPPDVQEFIERLAKKGFKVRPGRPDPNRILPEPLWANTSLSAAVIEEREEYEY
jgi:hypothetical protein